MHRTTHLAVLLCWLLPFCEPLRAEVPPVQSAAGSAGLVVSVSPPASRIGRDVLAQGGNAVDAAVATAFALAVSWPEAGNLGGGGFMMIRPADRRPPICVEYREVAPGAAKERMFAPGESALTHKAVGVPGTVAGLALAHKQYGRLAWRQLVLPAAELADQGVRVDLHLARSLNRVLERTGDEPAYAELKRLFGKPDASPWQRGDRLRQPQLAATLRKIAEGGGEVFYRGPVAAQIVAEMRRGGGLITAEDLSGYRAQLRPPIRGTYRGYEILGAPPPSSGGICLVEMLNILERFELRKQARYSPRTLHLMSEAMRRGFCDRARYLGDPDFVSIPKHLISKPYAKQLAAEIKLDRATRSETLAPEIQLVEESPDTTHFSVVDAEGMAVANTYTLEASWGSRIAVPGAGFVLNNEMGDFNWVPGHTDRRGRIGTVPNRIAPGKRMLSSQCPVIVTRDDRVVLVAGSPGGRTIINTVLQLLLNTLEYEQELGASVASPRLHHQWLPDTLWVERHAGEELGKSLDQLKAYGHRLDYRDLQGSAQVIGALPQPGRYQGVSDFRRGGLAAVVDPGVLAVWDFADAPGTSLDRCRRQGNLKSNWSRNLADSLVARDEVYRIQRDAPNPPLDAFVPLQPSDTQPQLWYVARIGGFHFKGGSAEETVRFGFCHTDTDEKPQITARMLLQRRGKDQVELSGEALGDGGSPIAAKLIWDRPLRNQPFDLALHLDQPARRYHIYYRLDARAAWQTLGSGKVAAGRRPHFARLSALNDFAAEGEYFDIDQIRLTTQSPLGD